MGISHLYSIPGACNRYTHLLMAYLILGEEMKLGLWNRGVIKIQSRNRPYWLFFHSSWYSAGIFSSLNIEGGVFNESHLMESSTLHYSSIFWDFPVVFKYCLFVIILISQRRMGLNQSRIERGNPFFCTHCTKELRNLILSQDLHAK